MISTSRITIAVLAVLFAAAACTVITDVDRSKIRDEGDAGEASSNGGSGNTNGGNGGQAGG